MLVAVTEQELKKVYDKAEPMSASRLAGDILWGDSKSLATNIRRL